MKKFLFSIGLSICSTLVFGQWTGSTSVTSGQTVTYTYTADFILTSYSFVATGGKVNSSSRSGDVYTVSITWVGGVTGGINFYQQPNNILQDHLNVTITGCAYTSPPVPPTPTVSTNVCGNKTISFNGTAPIGYAWYWQTSSTNTPATATTINGSSTYTATSSGYYYLMTKSVCSSTWNATPASVNVTVTPVPSAPAVTNATICHYGTGTLTAVAGANGDAVKWYTSSTGGTSFQPGTTLTITDETGSLATTTYFVTTTNTTAMCESSPRTAIKLFVSSSTLPGTPISGTNGSSCGAGTVSLSAVAGSNADGIHWRDDGLQLVASSANYSPNVTVTTPYYAYSYSSSTGCESRYNVPVTATVKPVPAVTVSPTIEICSGTSTNLTLTGSVAGSIFTWTSTATSGITGNAISGSGAINNTLTNANNSTGTATYVITPSANGCSGSASNVVVTVVPVPVINASGTGVLTYGKQVALSTTATGVQYQWKLNGTNISGATANSYTVNAVNTYALGIRNTTSSTLECVSTKSVTAAINSQPAAVNYVSVTGIMKAGVTPTTSLYTLNANELAQTIAYQDGLGRTFQTVGVGQSGTQTDVVSMTAFGKQGVTDTVYLPYTSDSKDGRFKLYAIRNSTNNLYTGSEQYTFYQGTAKVATDAQPYARSIYRASPDARVTEQGLPGNAWQPGTSHTIKNTVTLNTSSYPVRYWKYDGTTSGNYPTGTVAVNITTDENGNQVRTYTNTLGQTVLKQVQLDENINGSMVNWLDTYYIYDVFGRVAYQIPPKAMAVIGTNTTYSVASNSTTDELVYKYVYDSVGHVIEKKTPGAGWQYVVYDKLGRVVLTQDANLRAQSKWSFVKYDTLGRPVYSGLYVNTTLTTRKSLQNYFTNSIDYTTQPYAEYPMSNAAYQGYSNVVFPTTGLTVLSVNYYEDYDFDNNGSPDFTYDNTHLAGIPNTSTPNARGFATGSRKLILDANGNPTANWLTSVVFYDNLDRPIQTQSNSHLNLAVQDKASVLYFPNDLTTHVKQTYATHVGATTVNVSQTYTYDDNWRTTGIFHSINGSTPQQLAAYEYNALGQLVDKKLHVSGSSFLQSVDLRYNIRGWLTSINNAQLTADANVTNDETTDYFGMELAYNTLAGMSNTPYYNGNISAIKWKTGDVAAGATGQRSYTYNYDKSEKLKTAAFKKYGTSAWDQEQNTLDETMSYDHGGNILSLQRNQNQHDLIGTTVTSSVQTIDNLAYTYGTGNQLSKVHDNAANTVGFNDGTTNSGSTNEYSYDATGSLTKDDNKGISSIAYNFLGKPQTVTFTDGRSIAYTYDASGNKLKVATTVSGTTTTTDYVSNYVYTNNALSFFSSPEGRVVKNGSNYEYQYAIADHQGNTRVVFTSATPASVPTTATFEGGGNDQSSQFSNVTAIPFGSANHTTGGSYVVRLNQAKPVGPGLNKAVFPGDKVDMEAYSYYEATSGYGTATIAIASMISSVSGALVNNLPDAGGIKASGVNSAMTNFGQGANQGDNAPAAFLNYILFDKNYKVMDAGWQVVTPTAFSKQKVSLPQITVKEVGYIFVYLSYDDVSNNYVYFDDFKVTVTPTNIIQSNEYYAFGSSTANSWTRDNTTGNNFLANGGTELNATSALYDLEFRNYDPILGRMHQVDPMASKYSSLTPYNFAFNRPNQVTDVNGADPNPGEPDHVTRRGIQNFDQAFYGPFPDFNHTYNFLFGDGIAPGSGNNWADGLHSMDFNMATMFTGTFEKFYNVNLNKREDQWRVGQAVATRVSVAEFHPGCGLPAGVWVAGKGFINAKEFIQKAGMNHYISYRLDQLRSSFVSIIASLNPYMVTEPPWMHTAWTHASLKEWGKSGDNPGVIRLFDFCQKFYGCEIDKLNDEIAWCAAFVNFSLGMNNIPGTGTAWALDFSTSKNFYKLDSPVYGAIGIYQSIANENNNDGHAAFFLFEDSKYVYVLGGNQGPRNQGAVTIAPFLKGNFCGFYFPTGYSPSDYGRH